MTNATPQTNDAGFVKFASRSNAYKGDRYTWARYNDETRELTVNVAQSGTLSNAYKAELAAFCAAYGIDWDAMRCGDRVVVTVPAAGTETAEGR